MTSTPDAVALDGLDLTGADGAVWSLPHRGDLDANLVKLAPGSHVAGHHNDEVDVLLVVLAGHGTLTVDDEALAVGTHHLVRIPRGADRRLEASAAGLVYLSVHRARTGLQISPARRRP
ncbi:MAG: cupin domain-containing protein [Actinomycetota bacterium]|jgi:quercetin dioxygenase-like cupin family protein